MRRIRRDRISVATAADVRRDRISDRAVQRRERIARRSAYARVAAARVDGSARGNRERVDGRTRRWIPGRIGRTVGGEFGERIARRPGDAEETAAGEDRAGRIERDRTYVAGDRRTEGCIGCARAGARCACEAAVRRSAERGKAAACEQIAAGVEGQRIHGAVRRWIPRRIGRAAAGRREFGDAVARLSADAGEIAADEKIAGTVECERVNVVVRCRIPGRVGRAGAAARELSEIVA